jgi:hypothetical protein
MAMIPNFRFAALRVCKRPRQPISDEHQNARKSQDQQDLEACVDVLRFKGGEIWGGDILVVQIDAHREHPDDVGDERHQRHRLRDAFYDAELRAGLKRGESLRRSSLGGRFVVHPPASAGWMN